MRGVVERSHFRGGVPLQLRRCNLGVTAAGLVRRICQRADLARRAPVELASLDL